MAFLKVLSICLVVAIVFNFVECSNDFFSSEIDVIAIQNVTAFLNGHPGIRVLYPLTKESFAKKPSKNSLITFQIGKRVRGKRKF